MKTVEYLPIDRAVSVHVRKRESWINSYVSSVNGYQHKYQLETWYYSATWKQIWVWILIHRQCLTPWILWKKNISSKVSEEFCIIKTTSSLSVWDWEFYELADLTYSAEFLLNFALQITASNLKHSFFIFFFLCANPENVYHFHTVLWTLSIFLPPSNYAIKTCEGWWLTTFKFQAHSKIFTSCTVRVAMLPAGKTA